MPKASVRVERTRAFRETISSLAQEMEEPLTEAADLVSALKLMGFGLDSVEDRDAGQPVLAVAEALSERLDMVRDYWRQMFKAMAPKKIRKKTSH
ncbi:MAG TPA: hypothetical protein VG889_23030 [Rhizomicrobium sp.]|nr:hypothetical protein [Rhizomicrobium sp.]